MSLMLTTQCLSMPSYPVRTVLAAMAGASLIVGFFADLVYLGTGDVAWMINAAWLLLAGSLISGFAVMAAFLSAARQRGEGRRQSWTGLLGFCTVWGLSVASAVVHSHGVASFPTGLVLSALVAVLVMVLGRAHWQAIAMLDRR